jgi:uncharacterized 2Fe-2S/4Fe-4S cluster protein (DUF4445 family)
MGIMSAHKVTFLPEQKSVEVEAGATIIEAAETAGVYLNSLCGGVGVCGKCRVQIVEGRADHVADALAVLSKEEVQKGYVLACQSAVTEDLEVLIPPESRIEEEQILSETRAETQRAWAESSAVSYSEPDWICQHRRPEDPACLFKPLTCKVRLDLPAPSADDNVADTGRLLRELRRKTKSSSVEIPFDCLRDMGTKLRLNDWKVSATLAVHDGGWRLLQLEPGDAARRNYGVAVDVGTTTVVAQLIDLGTGEVLGVEGSHNLQARHGEDVLSRIGFTCGRGSLEVMQRAVVENVNSLLESLCRGKSIELTDVTAVVAAGNTTMSHLLLGLPPCTIRDDPYVPTVDQYPQLKARDLGIHINPEAVVEVLPCVSSYVGGDIVAGVIATGLADKADTTCLIDVGTNGEIVVGNNQWMLSCSASAGPAFEGGDTKCGMRATRGAVLIGELAKQGIVDIDGKLRSSEGNERVVQGEGELEYVVALADETETGEPLVITQSDIDNVIRSKAAVFAATKSLLDYADLSFEDLDRIYIAGGFGNYLDIDKTVAIGLLPDVPRDRIEFVGNSSLLGARMSLLSHHVFDKAVHISQDITNIELSRFAPFTDEYMAALYIPHIDRDRLFPSVGY